MDLVYLKLFIIIAAQIAIDEAKAVDLPATRFELRVIANHRDHRPIIEIATGARERVVRRDGRILGRWVTVDAHTNDASVKADELLRRRTKDDEVECHEVKRKAIWKRTEALLACAAELGRNRDTIR